VWSQPVKRVPLACLALLAVFAPAVSGQEWKTSVPFTYLIDYSQGHVGNPEYLRKIADAPPTLMHVGEDVVFSSVYGTKGVYGGPQGTRTQLITADEASAKIGELRRYTDAMHRAGARWVIPYINNLAILGDHVRRTGFWEFFDNWDRFRAFGFGPRPAEDIVTAQMFGELPHPERLKDNDPNYPYKRYEMCVNNPIWRKYLLAVTLNIARTGMDGVFADEMILRDYCRYDQEAFRAYLARKYGEAERQRRFGQSDLRSLRLGYPGEGALWYETQAFWSYSLGQFLKALRDEGRKVNPEFFVATNIGPFAHLDGASKRASGGKDPGEWAPYTRLIMFEEMQRPGQLGPHTFFDNILQFKLAFGLGFTAGTLLYYAQDAPGIELAMAEAGAGGGGAFIQGGYTEPESRRKYRKFFETHVDLFQGYESQADVAVVFDYDQAYWGSIANLWSLYALSGYLSNRHIPYDVIPLAKIRSERLVSHYKAVITPGLWYLADETLVELRRFAERGGLWFDIGNSGKFDDAGRIRARPRNEPRLERVGKGLILRRDDLQDVLPLPRFALYLLKEREANDLKEIVKLYEASQVPEFPYPPKRRAEDLQTLLEKSVHTSLSVLPERELEGLRCNAWRKQEGTQDKVVAHFVNYYTRIPTNAEFATEGFKLGGPPEDYAPRALNDIQVRIRIPSGKVTAITAFDPDVPQPVSLECRQAGGAVEFALSQVRIYKIVQLTISRESSGN
jgi:hypothetical protein